MSKTEAMVQELAQPIVDELGLELVDVEFKKEGGNWYLRVFIDKAEGISHEDCQAVSQQLSNAIDEQDPIEQAYFLEVSSPGLERPLKKPEDFDKFRGAMVYITTYTPIDSCKTFQGKLEGLEEGNVILMVEEKRLLIPYEKVASARLAVEF